MATTTVLRTPTTTFRPPSTSISSAVKAQYPPLLSYSHCRWRQTPLLPRRCRIHQSANPIVQLLRRSVGKFLIFASNGDATEAAQVETQEPEQVPDSEHEENLDGAAAEDASEGDSAAAEESLSVVATSLQLYRDALANNDDSKIAEIEISLKFIEDERIELQRKVATLTEELSSVKDRVLRISADFDNYRKRTDRERLSLVTNAQGEVVEKLLSVLDNFERAKTQIKVETEGEEKINNSYQGIAKQFVEILKSLGVEPVKTVGKPFDPLLHEAIMREDSTEFVEGVIIEEYRKGFRLGDRLLRPSMVKVSAGPGPAKPETAEPAEEQNEVDEKSEEGSAERPVDNGTGEGGN